MQQSTAHPQTVKQIQAALASARALVASLEATLDQAQQPADDPALSLAVASKATRLSPHTLRTWCRRGRLQYSRGARGAYLVRVSDINDAIAAAPTLPSPPRADAQDLEAWEQETASTLAEMEGT